MAYGITAESITDTSVVIHVVGTSHTNTRYYSLTLNGVEKALGSIPASTSDDDFLITISGLTTGTTYNVVYNYGTDTSYGYTYTCSFIAKLYSLTLQCGTGITSYKCYTSESSTSAWYGNYHIFSLPAGGRVYLEDFTYSTGYSYPVNCTNLAGTGTFVVMDSTGTFVDNEVQISSSGGNRSATLTATVQETFSISIKLTAATATSLTFTCIANSAKSYDRTIKIYHDSGSGTTLIGSGTLSASNTSVSITCSGLSSGSTYEASAYMYYGSTLQAISSARVGYTNYNLTWTGLGAGTIASGQPVSNLTASAWNLYRAHLHDKCVRYSRTYTYDTVEPSDSITAASCRDVNLQFYYLYGVYPVNHSYLTGGLPIYASYFNTWMTYMNKDDNTYDT